VCALSCALSARSAEDNGPVRRARPDAATSPDRILVVWNPTTQSIKTAQVEAHAKLAGTTVASQRQIAPQLEVLQLASKSPVTAAAMLANLRADPRVRFADYDHRRFAHATTPNDPGFPYQSGIGGQWYLQGVEASAIRANVAWDTTRGSSGIVIADLDTGIRYDHPDLRRATAAGKLLPGYDFVTDVLVANDGNGRDSDPSDPGDWITAAEANTAGGPFFQCTTPDPVTGRYLAEDSSWHGTRTAGIIGALTNNTVGIAGVNWNAYIVPVRVLGKCGGFDSDIITAMRWAAGIAVAGAPVNPYPARVINMSLGGTGSCSPAYQGVFNELTALGVMVVASAGNDGRTVAVPANCPGAVAVAGLRYIGTKVGFSNLGSQITISAPGGNCVNTNGGPCLFSIDTTTDTGATSPVSSGYTDQSNFNVGTSFSAPMVSGVTSLMMGVDANLRPSDIIARLRAGATTPFPTNPDPAIPTCHEPAGDKQDFECNCTTATCGAGMLNAAGALTEALRPIASVALPASVSAGGPVALNANSSVAACGRTIASYAWTAVSGTPVISNASQANASVTAPATGSIVVRLTVTDDNGKQDTADVTITPNAATSSVQTITPVNSCPTPLNVPQIAAPTVTISANPTTVKAGQASMLTWSSTDATTCTASGSWTGTKTTSGTQTTGTLSSTSTFSLVCDGLGGTSSTQSVTVTVLPGSTATLSVTPTSVTSGQSATLTWSSTNATGCTASDAWTGAKATSGSESTGALTVASTYTLMCDGPGGASAPQSVTVTIAAPSGSGGGGGGGGVLGLLSLFALSLLLAVTRRPVSA
jgi:serine protease